MTMDYPLQRLVLRRLRVVASALASCFGLSDAYTKGGASIWQTQTIDPELGPIYFTTGNAVRSSAGPTSNPGFRSSTVAAGMTGSRTTWSGTIRASSCTSRTRGWS